MRRRRDSRGVVRRGSGDPGVALPPNMWLWLNIQDLQLRGFSLWFHLEGAISVHLFEPQPYGGQGQRAPKANDLWQVPCFTKAFWDLSMLA